MYKLNTHKARRIAKPLLGAASLVLATGLLSSCQMALNDITPPIWQPNILGPIAHAELELEDFEELAVITLEAYVDASEIGLNPGVIGPTQADRRSGVSVGPYLINWIDGITRVDAGQAKVRLRIQNEIPVEFNEGAVLRVVQEATGQTVLTHEIGQSLSSFGRLVDSILITDLELASGLAFYLDNLTFQPVQGQTIEPSKGFLIQADIQFNDVREARVTSGSSVVFSDTVDLNIDLTEDLDRYIAEGELRLNVGNGFPFGGRLDVEFISKNGRNTLGRLTPEVISVNIPAIDAQGQALESAPTQIIIPLNDEQLRIVQRSGFLGFSGEVYAPASPASVVANGTRALDVQLIADIQFTVQP
jgi:hypothetical protein